MISMKTPDGIKKGLECCGGDCFNGNEECPYDKDDLRENISCIRWMAQDALAYIHQLERERDALAALYKTHGTCGSCKHNGSKLCDNCTNKDNRWEWAGIKEDNP